MPIKLDRELPVLDILRKENVFIMEINGQITKISAPFVF